MSNVKLLLLFMLTTRANDMHIIICSYFSGDVVTLECVEKVIKKDMICPITGQKLKDSDIIVMERVSIRLIKSTP